MIRPIYARRVALSVAALALVAAGPVRAEDRDDDQDRIVAPSEYLEDIETPGDTGGVMDEADAAEAQAEAAEAAAKKKAEAASKPDADEGGW